MRPPILHPVDRRRAFTLLELLCIIAIIALLVATALPAMSAARRQGLAASCSSRLRELGRCLQMYANDYDDRAMPLAYWMTAEIGTGPVVYWWGTNDAAGVDHDRGFIAPYMQSRLEADSVYECPAQRWGTYLPQGAAAAVTSTYGYNGYYLSPLQTPGWGLQMGHRPWQSLARVRDAARVFAFADALIDLGAAMPHNTALLDPPMLYSSGAWDANMNPTTSFRHDGRTTAVSVDGHVENYRYQPTWITSPEHSIGSVGLENGPHYVPDWPEWTP